MIRYSSIRLFREPRRGEWGPVIAHVVCELEAQRGETGAEADLAR